MSSPDAANAVRPLVPRRRMLTSLIVMATVLALVGAALYGFNWYRQRAVAQFFAANKPPPAPVAVAEASLSAVPRKLVGIGTLAAVREVTISAEVAGTVAAVEFQSGQSVSAGTPLVRLDDRTERAELAALQAQQRLAEQTLGRTEALRQRGVTPQANLDQARSQIEQLAANAQRAQVAIDKKVIAAPFGGELGVRLVDLGQFLSPGTGIVTLTDLSRLHANFTLPEQSRALLRAGLPVEVRTDAFPGSVFAGEITAIDPQVNPATRAIRVQSTMNNPGSRLLPGMFADVTVVLPPEPGIVTLPETALVYTLYGDSVFVVRRQPGDGAAPAPLTVQRVLVQAGERFAGRVAIRSGVASGELVVVSGQNRLTDGAAVTVAAPVEAPGSTQTRPAPAAARGSDGSAGPQ